MRVTRAPDRMRQAAGQTWTRLFMGPGDKDVGNERPRVGQTSQEATDVSHRPIPGASPPSVEIPSAKRCDTG